MKIVDIECHVLVATDFNAKHTSSAQDSFIVVVKTDEGLNGIGESDVNPWIAKACIEAPGTHTMSQGVKTLLIGADPMDIEGLWQRLYVGTAMDGRRGALIHAIGAVEMALWDLKGKALSTPVCELLGGDVRDSITVYASLQPSGSCWQEYRDSLVAWAIRAREIGYKAVKAEITMNGPYAHNGMSEGYDKHTRVLEAVRGALGDDMMLMVDVQYMWPDAESALRTIRDWGDFNLFFLETPVWVDRIDDHAVLHEAAPMPIATGEWFATVHEFETYIDRGCIDVAQPDVGRVGGLLEAKKVCDLAASRGRTIVPHCWKTGVSISATAHLALVTPHCPVIEYLPPELCEESLRRELVAEELGMVDGAIRRPMKPGLGIELDWNALRKYKVA